jgi:signal transduction histidine kinase
VRLNPTNRLEVEISDDGHGLPENIITGVGLNSMRERAEELGGSFTIRGLPNGGTQVLASLPLKHFSNDSAAGELS